MQSNTMVFNNARRLIQSLTSLIFLPLQNMYLMCTCVYVNLWTQVSIKLHSEQHWNSAKMWCLKIEQLLSLTQISVSIQIFSFIYKF